MTRTLYVGDKHLSSWSLRPYLALAHAGLDFATEIIRLDQPTTKAAILRVNPAGKVPALRDGDLVVWDSLAICEYAAELAPDAGLWPSDQAARARARAVSAEMHSGFAAMRRELSMSLFEDRRGRSHGADALADVARVQAIWTEALDRSGGPYLFGDFTIADAMYAPVVTRFRTYGVEVPATLRVYMETIEALPALQRWIREARAELPQSRP